MAVQNLLSVTKRNLLEAKFSVRAARLLEHFQPKDPITSTEVKSIEVYLENILTPLWVALKKFPCDVLVGSSVLSIPYPK